VCKWLTVRFYLILNNSAFSHLIERFRLHNKSLKKLVIFENFNQKYTESIKRLIVNGVDWSGCETIREPCRGVGRKLAEASLSLEHLAVSFIADASHFFEIGVPRFGWPNLSSLVLTSQLLTPGEEPARIMRMLRDAAVAAYRMPRLETMVIWNGRKGFAGLFKYQACPRYRQGTITWRGTWDLILAGSVIYAWGGVVYPFHSHRLTVVHGRLGDDAVVNSHADAIHYLSLSDQVIRPVSLQQIWIEHEAMKDAEALEEEGSDERGESV
jgi:hypothetical protein